MDREERWLPSQNSWWMALLDMFYLAKRGNIFMYNHLLTLFLKELFLDAQKPSCVKRFAYWSWLQPKNKNKFKKKRPRAQMLNQASTLGLWTWACMWTQSQA